MNDLTPFQDACLHIRFWASGQIALEAKDRINKIRKTQPSYAVAMAEEWIIKYQ
jgi:hypothetical protein